MVKANILQAASLKPLVSKKAKRKRGRPGTRVVKIDASPEYAAKAIVATGKTNNAP